MTVPIPPQCLGCERLETTGPEWRWTCTAYPVQIPHAILFNEVDHREPVNDDKGQQFIQSPFRPEPLAYEYVFDEESE